MTRTREAFDKPTVEIADAAAESRPPRWRVSTAIRAHTVLLLFISGVLIFSSPLVRRDSLSAIGEQMVWFNIVAVSLCVFAAALCITRWSSPATRLLGLFLIAFSVYQFGAIAGYAPTRHQFVVVSSLTWFAIPLCFVLWTRATLYIVAATPSDDAPGRSLSAVLMERWQRLQSWHHARRRGSSILPLELFAVWLPAAVFIVLGPIPGLLYSYSGRSDAWRGWQFEPHLGFVLMGIWGLLIGSACSALLYASWRQRAPHLLPGIYERARWAPRATMVLTFFILFAFASALGLWPESVLDLCIAICAVPYALLAIDADSFGGTGAAYSSFRQRLLAAALWCGMTLAIVAIVEPAGNPITRGLFAALVAGILPVGLSLSRTLMASDDMKTEPSTLIESGEYVAAELCKSLTEPVSAYLSLDVLDRTRRMLREIDGHDLKTLIGGLPGPSGRKRNELHDPRADSRLRIFVRDFPALDCSHAWEVRMMRLNKLVYETTRSRIGYDVGANKDDPGRWRALAAYCLLRLDPGDSLIGRFEREERLRLRVWLKGERAGLSFYDDIEQMDEQALRTTFHNLAGEESAQRRKKVLERALDATLKQVIAHWEARAEHALGERLPDAVDTSLLVEHFAD